MGALARGAPPGADPAALRARHQARYRGDPAAWRTSSRSSSSRRSDRLRRSRWDGGHVQDVAVRHGTDPGASIIGSHTRRAGRPSCPRRSAPRGRGPPARGGPERRDAVATSTVSVGMPRVRSSRASAARNDPPRARPTMAVRRGPCAQREPDPTADLAAVLPRPPGRGRATDRKESQRPQHPGSPPVPHASLDISIWIPAAAGFEATNRHVSLHGVPGSGDVAAIER